MPPLGPVCQELDERHPSCPNLRGPREESDERHLSGPNPAVQTAPARARRGLKLAGVVVPPFLPDKITVNSSLGLPFRIVNL